MQLITGNHILPHYGTVCSLMHVNGLHFQEKNLIMALCKLTVVCEVQILIYVIIKYNQA